MIFTIFCITSLADTKNSNTFFPFSADILIAIPQIIDATKIAIIFSFDNNLLKSLTVNN